MDTSKLIHEYREAWRRIKTPKPPPTIKPIRKSRCANQEEVLKIARELYSPGDLASPMEISKRVKFTRSGVSAAITVLRRKGKWPYRGGRVGLTYQKKNAH